jgi:hypothetical protein
MSTAPPTTIELPPQYNPSGDARSRLVAVPMPRVGDHHGGSAVRRRLGEVLTDQGLVSQQQLDTALAVQTADPPPRRRLGQVVAALGFATERQVAEALATHLGLAAADLSGWCPRPTSCGCCRARWPSAPGCSCSTGTPAGA